MSTGVYRWLFLILSLSSWTTTDSKEMRVVCYYTNWSVYRPGDAKFTPQNINPYLCTHLIYAFGGFTKENTLKPFDKYQDIEKGGYAKFTGLKTYNKNLKTMLAIGGWNEGSTRFSPMVANPDRRKELVKNSIKFLRQNHFDGLDLDWEYPAFRDGGKARDRENYALLVKELREEFERESDKTGRPRLLLTMAVPAGIEYATKGYDVPKLMKYLDWMNILSYDYHSAFEPAVNHHAPLYSLEEDNEYNYDAELSIDYTIQHYLKLGADPNKLVLGIPTYGRSYTLYNPDAYEIGSPADGPGTMGEATRENGYLAYYEICDYIKNQDWEVDQPNPKAMGPYAFKDNQWVGYDDADFVSKKAEYVVKNGLGGIMFWAIDNDDFRGKCHNKQYPLIEAGKEALLNAYGTRDENLISPPAKPIKSGTRNRTKISKNNLTKETKEAEVEKISSTFTNLQRNRIKPKPSKVEEVQEKQPKSRQKLRRKESTTEETSSYSSLKITTPSYTTPAPPATPDMGGAFKCEDEGFFPHPKDCKKYFWCLSGAGDSEIVAHQFTCPAGLYFNKAADSCDYTQNVLCNKKIQKTTTSSTKSTTEDTSPSSATLTTTAASTLYSTSRILSKITTATSKTTAKTTTTEAYEEEYEYEDENEENEPSKDDLKNDSEEDPQVIKELIALIKKAGGIEELEKQLKIKNSSISSRIGDSTTESTIGKSLFERLKALKNTENGKKNIYVDIRNSRGPQNEGIKEENKSRDKTDRGKLQYTSISRQRPSTPKPVNGEEEEEEEEENVDSSLKSKKVFEKPNQLEYFNIRRGRGSTSTETPEKNKVSNRSKILGEENNDEEKEYEDDEEKDEEKPEESVRDNYKLQYTNIRRQRPSSTEGLSTSRYVEIHRSTTPKIVPEEAEEDGEEGEETTPKYKIRRPTTALTTSEPEATSNNVQSRRGTTDSPKLKEASNGFNKKYSSFNRSTTEIPSTTEPSRHGSIAEKGEITTLFVSPNIELKATPSLVFETTEPALSINKNDKKDKQPSNKLKNDSEIIGNAEFSAESEISSQETFSSSTENTHSSSLRPSVTEPTITTQSSKVSQFSPKFRQRSKPQLKNENISSNENTQTSAQFLRIRGGSRFKANKKTTPEESQEDTKQLIPGQSRKRLISTTEKYLDENRNYRPSELADLSSLTAVDFERIKELNKGQTYRRRRPVRLTTSTTVSSTADEQLDHSLLTGPRTLPLAGKLISTSSFGKTVRTVGQEQNSTQNASKTRIRGYRTTRQPSNQPTATESSSTVSSFTPRIRKILKVRVTSPSPKAKDKVDQPNRREFGLFNQNQSQPVKQRLFNQKAPQLFPLEENNVDEENDDSFEDNINDEEENIKLSESNIKENSQLNSFGSDIKEQRKFANQKEKSVISGKSLTSKFESKTNQPGVRRELSDQNSTTPSNLSSILRTRTFRRKLPTTESTIASPATEANQLLRKRKLIRVRPVPKFQQISENENKKITSQDSSLNLTSKNISLEANVTIENISLGESENITTAPILTNTTEAIGNISQIQTESVDVNLKRIFRPKLGELRTRFNLLKDIDDSENGTGIHHIPTSIKDSNDSETGTYNIRNNIRKYIRNGFNKKVDQQKSENNNTASRRISRPSILRTSLAQQNETISTENSENQAYNYSLNLKTKSIQIELNSTKDDIDKDKIINANNQTVIDNMYIWQNVTAFEKIIVDNENANADREIDEDGGVKENDSNEPEDITTPENEEKVSTTIKPSTTVTEESTKRNNNFRRPQDRPSFARSRLTIKNEEKDRPSRYRSVTITTTSTTPITETNFNDEKEEASNKSNFNRYRFKSRYNLSSTTTNPILVQYANKTEESTEAQITIEESAVNNTTILNQPIKDKEEITSTEAVSDNYTEENKAIGDQTIFYGISTTEKVTEFDNTINDEHLAEMSTLTNFKTNTNSETTTDIPTTSTVVNKMEDNQESTIITNTLSTENPERDLETTLATENVNESTSPLPLNEALPTTESTPYHQVSTLRSINARPKFSPPKSKLPGTRPKPKFLRDRLQTTTSTTKRNLVEEDNEKIETSSKRYGKFLSRYSTTTTKSSFKPTLIKTFTRKKPDLSLGTTPIPLNKLIYRYTTAKKYIPNEDIEEYDDENDDNEDEEEEYDFEEGEDEEEREPEKKETNEKDKNDEVRPLVTPPSTTKKTNKPLVAKKTSTKAVNIPVFAKTTEAPKVNEDFEDIDREAIKTRNKNLFSKTRKMNTPFVGQLTTALVVTSTQEHTTPESTKQTKSSTAFSESSTKRSQSLTEVHESTTRENVEPQETTTEFLTTLHHIFAEVTDANIKTTSEATSKTEITTNKVERIVEVNRIVKVKTKQAKIKNHKLEAQKTNEAKPILDKVGEVNRVAVINVVDIDGSIKNITDSFENEVHYTVPKFPVYIPGKKDTNDIPIKEPVDSIIEIAKVQEIPAKTVLNKINLTDIIFGLNSSQIREPNYTNREERKFEIYGGSKITSFKTQEFNQGKAEIIDGISHINIITPRPIFNTEASTISLEGLFQIKKPNTLFDSKSSSLNDELLDTENSKFVQVRVLHPDEIAKFKRIKSKSNTVPIKLLKQDEEEVTMKAHVVEIKPVSNADMIKIIPIRVEMSKKLTKNSPTVKQNTTPT